jgi:serine phosphatase RsbU (regulator of sigma subunit)
VLDDLEITAGRATLHPGDSLVLLTDGIVETFSPDNQLFGDDRLRETIAKAPNDPTGMLWSLLEAVDEHAAGGPRRDDQCVVVIKRP